MGRESAENYRSAVFNAELKKRARILLAGLSVVAFFWVFLIVSAPVAAASQLKGFAEPVYGFFGYVCHQIPERSFFLIGNQFAVCSRCFGVYFGLLAGLLCYPFVRPMDESSPLPRVWLFLSMVPMALDWSLDVLGIWANTHFTRLATGLILGVACALFIVPAVIEVAELRLAKSRQPSKKAAG